MTVSKWMHVGTVLKMNALNFPDKLGCQDKHKTFTFKEWNERSCRLASSLKDMGVGYQERFAIIAYNRVEWMEIYAACAKGGQIAVPIMFRLAPPEIEYIINHSESKAFIVEEPFVETINSIRDKLPTIPKENFIYLGEGKAPNGYIHYEDVMAKGSAEEPDVMVDAADTWTFMYTSGTTGRPKGVVKTHESYIAQYLLNNINMGVRPTDKVMLVMPMCHVNSIFYSFPYTYVTAPVMVYNMISFDPEDLLKTIAEYKITFTSLVPTHYIMMLALPDEVKKKYDVSCIRQLLISSAPARKDLKLAIMDYFKNAELWEAYGSTEAGLVTLLRPEDQFKKLGSIGREIFGIDRIKILDENGNEVPVGEIGELYSRTPQIFKEYWKDPEKTKEVFQGEWFTAGDMAKKDEDGYYYLVDRKANMIITGGENVYPSEVENVVGAHPAIKDVAVIGVPDPKWGEAVKAVVILHDGYTPSKELEQEIIEFCKGKIAGYKRPKSVDFIKDEEMPRTGTGKILHRVLRERYGKWSEEK
ncbi:MAG: long-chain fatty acid--CoA ligase [Deltaproteobacteria bacterium]|nr:MAG: long-chain fatty acid--CoA ligase [Deltaproteobacteria bacterium]